MNSIFKLKDIIQSTNYKNTDNLIDKVMGININKEFMPTIGNITKKNLTRYKIIYKDDFACNLMHIGRDEVLVIAKYNENNPAIVSSSYKTFKIKNENVLPDYLSLYFKRPVMDRMSWFYTDSSIRGSLAWNDFVEFEITIPPLSIQQKIIKINNLLNDQIEIINNINNNLSKLSTIIHSEFIKKMENNKESIFKDLNELGNIVMGQSPKGESYNYDNIGLPLINGAADYENGFLKAQKYTSDPKKTADKNDLIFCIRATIGLLVISDKKYCLGRGVAGITNINQTYKEYSFHLIKSSIENFKRAATGSVISGISRKDIENIVVKNPSNDEIKEYHSIQKPIFDKIEDNRLEINKLTKLRDTLLPKLMSGEIDVSKINFDLE